MSTHVRVSQKANIDIQEQSDYLSTFSLNTGLRYLQAVRETVEQLADMPYMGHIYEPISLPHHPMRIWSVKGFRRYLIIYNIEQDCVNIIRVLHGARNIVAILHDDT